jgi:hypothetical protein
VGVIDRAGAAARRAEALRGIPTRSGFDRDEAPPAVLNTGGPTRVDYISPADNRGAEDGWAMRFASTRTGR